MSDLFHYIAADDEHDRRQMRVAVAVANKRVRDQFGTFFANSSAADRAARLSLVEDDIRAAIASVGEEYGVDTDTIESEIIRNLAGNTDHLKEYQFKPKGEDAGELEKEVEEEEEEAEAENPKSASVKEAFGGLLTPEGYQVDVGGDQLWITAPDGTPYTFHPGTDPEEAIQQIEMGAVQPAGTARNANLREARRPKMCPYHSEVTDISLGTGDPQAGYNALSNQAWGDKHCKGGFDGTCNFKPQMVTQKFWEDKKNEYAERARQRTEDSFNNEIPSLEHTEPVMDAEPLAESEGVGVTDLDSELAEAPSAVGEMALASRTTNVTELTPELSQALEICHQNGYAVMGPDGQPLGAFGPSGMVGPRNTVAPPEVEQAANSFQARQAADAPEGAGGARKRVSLPKADESGLGGPSPKIDKGNSGDERGWTLDDIDTQMSNTPHPTVQQDPTDKAQYDKREFLDQTDAVTKQVDLPSEKENAGFNDGGQEHEEGPFTWTEDNGADPVTREKAETVLSSWDSNPLQEIIESNYGGFLPAADVDSAISDFE